MLTDQFEVKLLIEEYGNIDPNIISSLPEEIILPILSIDAPSRTITVLYSGSYEGVFCVVVSNQSGRLLSNLLFTTEITITSISPSSGS